MKWVALAVGAIVSAVLPFSDTVAQWVSVHPATALIVGGLAQIIAAIAKSPLYQSPNVK
ncbi:hypothetical protein [Caudoviricetes sp.]|nr:hypothetical protein [Caudoviricetes sp.]UOF79661.1 hypothetical protein [Caudoviricetes sp.]UOF79864.1 hypothetical protein [Bacteriophage sp.]UOF81332.1 hypothetical protein [Caudoviricetes sp.]